MNKTFNVNGICYPNEHYMVNLDSKLAEIKQLVDDKKYFVINRYCSKENPIHTIQITS